MNPLNCSHQIYPVCYPSNNLVVMRPYGDVWDHSGSFYSQDSQNIPREEVDLEHNASEGADTFGLEFAALQYLNLLSNAEQLFNKLLNNGIVLDNEKEQIQRWLCLKQECEECIAVSDEENDDEGRTAGAVQHEQLARIDELTELNSSANSLTDDSQYESETESDFDSNHPDFEDKLDGYMERFKDLTDELIRRKLEIDEESKSEFCNEHNTVEICEAVPPFMSANNPVYYQGRRKSIHPGNAHIPTIPTTLAVQAAQNTEDSFQSESSDPTTHNAIKEISKSPTEPYKELKMLSSGNDAKRTQIKQVLADLDVAQKRIEELQYTIQIKEQFIREMIKNSDTRNCAKIKFQRKWSKLEEEYYKTRTQLAQAEALLHEIQQIGSQDALIAHKNEVERCKNLARHYEKRLKDIDMIKQIAGDSTKKVLELENSLQASKKQLEKLKRQLKKEESHKQRLEQELEEDLQRMKDLEAKYQLQMSKILEKGKGREDERLQWIAEETERLTVMRESSQKLHQQLMEQQTALDKREALLKEKVCQEKSLKEVSARITHLETILKDKTEEKDDKEALRQEIRNLRKTRDCLLDQRSSLDEKYHKDRQLSATEERKYLECAEAIEAIDAAIEYKNELICGRKELSSDERLQREQGEQLLMARLLKLSPDEMRILLYKYFQKVIDLREAGRKMEQQIDELEHQNEVHSWKMQEMQHALQTERLEAERRMVAIQREHQDKVHLMLRHFAEESGNSGTESHGAHLMLARDSEAIKLKRENKILRKKLQEFQLQQAGFVDVRSRSQSPVNVTPRQKSLPAPPGTSSASTSQTKVTREKNKVIIKLGEAVMNKKKTHRKNIISFTHHNR